MDTPITRAEHEEFRRRIEEENKRQDKRIELLEENAKRLEVQEQVEQGKRLEILESRDGEMWRKVISYAVTAIVGIVIGFIFKQIGM